MAFGDPWCKLMVLLLWFFLWMVWGISFCTNKTQLTVLPALHSLPKAYDSRLRDYRLTVSLNGIVTAMAAGPVCWIASYSLINNFICLAMLPVGRELLLISKLKYINCSPIWQCVIHPHTHLTLTFCNTTVLFLWHVSSSKLKSGFLGDVHTPPYECDECQNGFEILASFFSTGKSLLIKSV